MMVNNVLVADLMVGLVMLWYVPFAVVVYVLNDPCRYNVAITATTPLFKMTAYSSIYHLIVVCVERYVAIAYPLHYETLFTNRTLKCAISAAW